MKAVICKNAELSVEEVPDPIPGRGQALLSIERCGICGSDLHIRHHCDSFKSVLARVGFGDALPSSTVPVVFGHEFCGEIVDYGPGCDRKIKPGTRVVGQPVLRIGNAIHLAGLSPVATGAYAELERTSAVSELLQGRDGGGIVV